MADDGLLDPRVDLDWLIDTIIILAAAETYLLITRLTRWDLDTYQGWLATSFTRYPGRGRKFLTAQVAAVMRSDLGLWMPKTFASSGSTPIRYGLITNRDSFETFP